MERQNDRRGLRHDLYGRKSEYRAGDGGKEPRAFIANLVALVIEEAPNGKPQINTIRVGKPCSVTRREERDMEKLPQVLFWLGIASIPLSWVVWYFGPEIELVRPVISSVADPALKAVLQEAHAERWGIFVGLWPVTLLVLSSVVEKRVQT